jgi:hypothetical protein
MGVATPPPAAREPWDYDRQVGQRYWFEYHCWEDDRSSDAALWHRSHEQVTVIAELPSDADPGSTYAERCETDSQRAFRARWDDGFEWDVIEDELLLDRADFCRPDPPPAGVLLASD